MASKKITNSLVIDPRRLVPWDKNPRRNDDVVAKVARSIETFGFASPVVARTSDLRILAGHTRVKAALKLGLREIPVHFIELTDEQAAAFTLADNRLNEAAEWDEQKLSAVLIDLSKQNFDLSLTGFAVSEVESFVRINDPVVPVDLPSEPVTKHIVELSFPTKAALDSFVESTLKPVDAPWRSIVGADYKVK